MIAIVDLEIGNFANVQKALEGKLIKDPDQINEADKVVLPGVGNFGPATKRLKEVREAVLRSIENGNPFLGICLGMQLLFEKSEEEKGEGLGVFPGKAVEFPDGSPHIGWNQIDIRKENPLLQEIKEGSYFYFVHSYYLEKVDDHLRSAVTNHRTLEGIVTFTSVVSRDNVFGTQFHPEKSGENGKRVLQNFKDL